MTNPELAILSLIAERPRHGYDIEQVIEERGMREWTEIGFSSIYYLLKKLEKGGLVASQLEQQAGKGPARKVYHITESGQQAQLEGTMAALSAPIRGSVPFLLGLSNLPILPKEAALIALKSYATKKTENLNHMLARAENQRPLPTFVEAMFDYSQTLAAAELDWIKKFINEVEAGNV
jgi:hypothetical protein